MLCTVLGGKKGGKKPTKTIQIPILKCTELTKKNTNVTLKTQKKIGQGIPGDIALSSKLLIIHTILFYQYL